MDRHGRKLRVALVVVVVGVGALMMSALANGVSGSGSAWQVKKVLRFQPDKYAVSAKATSLGSNTKARGHLAVNNYPDRATVWFTELNSTYTSEYGYGSGTPSFQLSAL